MPDSGGRPRSAESGAVRSPRPGARSWCAWPFAGVTTAQAGRRAVTPGHGVRRNAAAPLRDPRRCCCRCRPSPSSPSPRRHRRESRGMRPCRPAQGAGPDRTRPEISANASPPRSPARHRRDVAASTSPIGPARDPDQWSARPAAAATVRSTTPSRSRRASAGRPTACRPVCRHVRSSRVRRAPARSLGAVRLQWCRAAFAVWPRC